MQWTHSAKVDGNGVSAVPLQHGLVLYSWCDDTYDHNMRAASRRSLVIRKPV